MTWTNRLALFGTLDYVALALLVAAWLLIGWRVESTTSKHPSTARIMAGYRREWMVQMITRTPRIFDAQILASLRQSTAFFASTSAIAIGGALAMIGNAEHITDIANDLVLASAPTSPTRSTSPPPAALTAACARSISASPWRPGCWDRSR